MINLENLEKALKKLNAIPFNDCSFLLSDLTIEPEGKVYNACQFKINGLKFIYRNAKITPKKIGQFVTFWQRDTNGSTIPYHETDEVDFYVVNVLNGNRAGQFIFPKSTLIENKIISTPQQEGKRGFRVYPIWDTPENKQAQKTKKWQIKYFIEFD